MNGVFHIVCAVVSGLLLWAGFPRLGLEWVAWCALVPLLFVVAQAGWKEAAASSYLTGLVMFGGVFYWIPVVPAFSWSGYALLVAYLSLYVLAFGLSLWALRRRIGGSLWLLAPPLWVTCEYARAHAGFLGSPWMQLSHSQFEHPVLLQITSVTGAYGVSFLLVLVNAALADWLLSQPWTQRLWTQEVAHSPCAGIDMSRRSLAGVAVALGLVASCFVFGLVHIDRITPTQSARVSAVQGNIPQTRKWDPAWREQILERHLLLTRQAAVHHPDVIVWPETSVPGDVVHTLSLQGRLADVARDAGSYLLVGTASNAKLEDRALIGKKFNSMVLFSPEGQLSGEYRKIVLVPFAEYAPIRQAALWVEREGAPWQDMVGGRQATVLTAGNMKIGTPICWENIFPDLFRTIAARSVHLMVNATNEAWFGDSSASEQFLAMSVFRAVENHVSVVRAANTGISSFIDPYGRITARLVGPNGKDLFVEGTLTRDVPLSTERTLYTKYGDVFAIVQIAVWGLLLGRATLAGHNPRVFQPLGVPAQGEQT